MKNNERNWEGKVKRMKAEVSILRISIEMAAFSVENSTENAAISIEIRSNRTCLAP